MFQSKTKYVSQMENSEQLCKMHNVHVYTYGLFA